MTPASGRPGHYGRLAAGACGLVLVIALTRFLPARQWTIALAERIRGAGATGVFLFIAVYRRL